MPGDTLDPSNPYRRNLILLSSAFLVYHFGNGELRDDLSFGLIPIRLDDALALTIFLYALMVWVGIKYWQNCDWKTLRAHEETTKKNSFGQSLVAKYEALEFYVEKSKEKGGIPNKGEHAQGQLHNKKAAKKLSLHTNGNHAVQFATINITVNPHPVARFKIIDKRPYQENNSKINLVTLTEGERAIKPLAFLIYQLCLIPKTLKTSSDYLSHTVALIMYGVTLGVCLIIRTALV